VTVPRLGRAFGKGFSLSLSYWKFRIYILHNDFGKGCSLSLSRKMTTKNAPPFVVSGAHFGL